MDNIVNKLVDKLYFYNSLSIEEYRKLLDNLNSNSYPYLRDKAVLVKKKYYDNKVYIRGLIEVSNYCMNNCYYCGIRKFNNKISRYILSEEEIISSCRLGYKLGFRSFVFQGGEGFLSAKEIGSFVKKIKKIYTEVAVTLSFGEYSKDDYQYMYDMGADRYLLRHESINKSHYKKLHPNKMKLENRIACLENLKDIGFAVGCGMMVGSPYQTIYNLAEDLKFIEEFNPDMCGVGPFISHADTYFRNYASGSVDTSLYILSIIRLIKPNILLPATTALATLSSDARLDAIMGGANVIMPNLTPLKDRNKYQLYNNKANTGFESAYNIKRLKEKILKIGYEIVESRGDCAIWREKYD